MQVKESKRSVELRPKTVLGKFIHIIIRNCEESIEQIGLMLMGELWQSVYLSIKDIIALSVLFRVPGVLFFWITKENFTDFTSCMDESPLSASFYACFVIISSDLSLWIVLASRTASRFFTALFIRRKKL
ncbi:hypothetical protein [Leptothoe spongobia]|uniref:Uncharacterized protein n=1 Tax=Leptothoe spongobia TAU-MAC 1115 TaxID=1967444 RepID=A0A947DG55_9CYAN|nr:hypothetical protein [Leptothoe spongobia]MBT9316310.1 hypothetical protein [Leptothoe spongobia TAU-MAC 1115]